MKPAIILQEAIELDGEDEETWVRAARRTVKSVTIGYETAPSHLSVLEEAIKELKESNTTIKQEVMTVKQEATQSLHGNSSYWRSHGTDQSCWCCV